MPSILPTLGHALSADEAVIGLTIKASLAARGRMARAANNSTTLRSAQSDWTCNALLNYLLQVVVALEAQDFIATLQGRKSGLCLTRPAAQIAMEPVDGVVGASAHFAECLVPSTNTGPLMAICCLRGVVVHALDSFFATHRAV